MVNNNNQKNGGRGRNGRSKPKPQRRNGNGRRKNQIQSSEFSLNPSFQQLGLSSALENARPLVEGVTSLCGSDFITALTVKSDISSVSDRILATFPITPSGYPGTRISQLSTLWERYRFKRFNIRYVPAVPNTLATQLVCYLDTDPTDDPTVITNADTLVRQATAQAGAQQWNFITPKVIPLARRVDKQWYYTGVDKSNERFNRQGTGFVIQITNPINFNGEALTADLVAGSLFLDWEVEFQIAQIEPAAIVAPSNLVEFQTSAITLAISGSGSTGTLNMNQPGYIIPALLGVTDLTIDGSEVFEFITGDSVITPIFRDAGIYHVSAVSAGTVQLKLIGETGITGTLTLNL